MTNELADDQKKVLDYVKEKGAVNGSDVSLYFGLTLAKAYEALYALVLLKEITHEPNALGDTIFKPWRP